MHIIGFGPSKTPPKFNEKTPRETQKERNGGGRGKKERNFGRSGGGGSSGGGVRRKVVQGKPNQQQPQQPQPQQRQTQNKWGPEGPAKSPKQGSGFGSLGQHTTTTQQQHTTTTTNHNHNTRKFAQNTKTLKLGKVGLAKVGQHSKTLKLAKVGLAKVGQDHDWPKSVHIGWSMFCMMRRKMFTVFMRNRGFFGCWISSFGEPRVMVPLIFFLPLLLSWVVLGMQTKKVSFSLCHSGCLAT